LSSAPSPERSAIIAAAQARPTALPAETDATGPRPLRLRLSSCAMLTVVDGNAAASVSCAA